MLYQRGAPADYRAWEQAGATGWGPSDVLPYYRKAERDSAGESKYHGAQGPVTVGHVPYVNPLSEVFFQAAGQMGFRRNQDFNDWSTPQDGFGRYKVTQSKGERVSAATAYLREAVRRPNLCVRTHAHVTNVNIDHAAATGVTYLTADGATGVAQLATGGEVLLCAGAIQSPQLLMLSGVGPRGHLEEQGIEVVKELNGVGEGLQDHPAALVSFESKKAVSLTDHIRLFGTSLINPLTLLDWFVRGKGALTTVACEQGGFFHTRDDSSQPDLQMRFVPELSKSASGMSSLENVAQGGRTKSGFTFQVLACRPESEGRIRLRDTSPFSKPVLEGLYLSGKDNADLVTLREGIKLGRELCRASAFDEYRGKELFPGEAVRTDDEIDQYIRSSIHSANALTGSCRMGREDDPLAVLDPELRVRGVRSLRVVDASAMPRIIGGQTAAPTIMLAEKAADMLLADKAQRRAAADTRMYSATPAPMPMPMAAAAAAAA